MVTVIDYEEYKNDKKEPFLVLVLEGGVETVISKETGRPYFTAKRASIPTTFDERKCKSLIGSTMPGIVRKEECDEYEFEIPDSKETIILSHTYTYVPEAVNEEDSVFADDSELN